VVPLLARVYPNGSADVNQFQAAGGPGFVLRELLHIGCLHGDVATVSERGIAAYGEVPVLVAARLCWNTLPAASGDADVVRTAAEPFSPTGGITAETAPSFMALPNVKVCGGSWLTPAAAVVSGDWGRITQLARAAAALR